MQAQQSLIYPRRSVSLAIAVFATLVAAAFGLALVVGFHPAAVSRGVPTTIAQHQQAPDAVERNAQLRVVQSGGPQSDLTRALPTAADVNQSPDAQERNAALSPAR